MVSGLRTPPPRRHARRARTAWEAAASCSGFRVSGFQGFRIWGSGFRVQGSGFRVQGSGFRVWGSGCRVQGAGFGFRAYDLGFSVLESRV